MTPDRPTDLRARGCDWAEDVPASTRDRALAAAPVPSKRARAEEARDWMRRRGLRVPRSLSWREAAGWVLCGVVVVLSLALVVAMIGVL